MSLVKMNGQKSIYISRQAASQEFGNVNPFKIKHILYLLIPHSIRDLLLCLMELRAFHKNKNGLFCLLPSTKKWRIWAQVLVSLTSMRKITSVEFDTLYFSFCQRLSEEEDSLSDPITLLFVEVNHKTILTQTHKTFGQAWGVTPYTPMSTCGIV